MGGRACSGVAAEVMGVGSLGGVGRGWAGLMRLCRVGVRLIGLCDVSAGAGRWLDGMMMVMVRAWRVWACVACLRGRWVVL